MKNFWDIYAYFYDAINCLLPYRDLMKKAYGKIGVYKGEIKILDAGCGTGNFARYLSGQKNFNFTYTGIDNSISMIKAAKNKNMDPEIFGFRPHDFKNKLRDKYSHIVCLNAVYAEKDIAVILRNFHRSLNFGGLLIIANPIKKPKIANILREHAKMLFRMRFGDMAKEVLIFIFKFPMLLAVILLNLFIKKKAEQQEFIFMDKKELTEAVEKEGFKVIGSEYAYGGTDVLLTAVKIMRKNEQVSIEAAYRLEDMEEIFKMRYNVYCEELFSLDENFDKKETDKFDEFSMHFMIRFEGEIVGYLRLILHNKYGFLMEDEFELPKYLDKKTMAEVSRLIIKKPRRDARLFFELLEAARIWSRENGIEIWCAAAQPFFLRLLGRRDFKVIEIGKEKEDYHNYKVIPLISFLCPSILN
jgi:ubiquinone/menaquinone biosynthesis C-methylase UbiE/N-acyl-L-homoserine lactone synthetase